MAFCGKCGTQVPEDSVFCGHCGTRLAPASEPVCKNCGAKLEDGMFFCSKCGTRVEDPDKPTYTPAPVPAKPAVRPVVRPVVQPTVQPTGEQELYRKKMVGYYKGITQISGEFVVTNKRITYAPMGIYVLQQSFEIGMNEISGASRTSVMGINLCIRVNTTDGKSHVFALGFLNEGDIDRVVDMINQAKQTA
jgi:ribosomal protein L40E